ncbi:hypothetical protein HGB07_10200 [Candidatus Roizmanbacteria bacterium]|nr:hypothetical protein [Candidatus Roizmanbacteria bacterium]
MSEQSANLLMIRDLITAFDAVKMSFTEQDITDINAVIKRAGDRKEARDKLYNYPPK